MSGSLVAMGLALNAVASGRRAMGGLDTGASALWPQNAQLTAPVPGLAASSRSPQHIGQVLPNVFMLSVALRRVETCVNLSDPLALLRSAGDDFFSGCRGAGSNRE